MSRLFEASLMFPLQKTRTRTLLELIRWCPKALASVCVCVCVYLSTLNLGKWMEFLMNTVKLMASSNAGSLLKTPNNQSRCILPPSVGFRQRKYNRRVLSTLWYRQKSQRISKESIKYCIVMKLANYTPSWYQSSFIQTPTLPVCSDVKTDCSDIKTS